MPRADFVKPNPLDSDVILDATARLLSTGRKTTPAPDAGKKSRGTPARKRPAQTRAEASRPPREEKTAARDVSGKKPLQTKQTQTKQKAAPADGKQKNRRKQPDRPRDRQVSHRSDRQKDSTEQASLMKPYYIGHED